MWDEVAPHSEYLPHAIDRIEPRGSLRLACVFLLKIQSVTVRGRGAAQCVGAMTDVLPHTPPGFHRGFSFFNPDTKDTCKYLEIRGLVGCVENISDST